MKSVKQIRDAIAKLEAELSEAEKREKAELIAKFEAMASAAGLSVRDVLGKTNGKRKAIVQFRHKSGAEWSGRGRRPVWAKDMSKGQLEAFRVDA